MPEQILAVQKMQDYFEARLTVEITLAALTDCCNFSPWYIEMRVVHKERRDQK